MAGEIYTFIDCTSLSITFDVMGIATVNFSIISNEPGIKTQTEIFGLRGYVINVSCIPMITAPKWYVSNVTLVATK